MLLDKPRICPAVYKWVLPHPHPREILIWRKKVNLLLHLDVFWHYSIDGCLPLIIPHCCSVTNLETRSVSHRLSFTAMTFTSLCFYAPKWNVLLLCGCTYVRWLKQVSSLVRGRNAVPSVGHRGKWGGEMFTVHSAAVMKMSAFWVSTGQHCAWLFGHLPSHTYIQLQNKIKS